MTPLGGWTDRLPGFKSRSWVEVNVLDGWKVWDTSDFIDQLRGNNFSANGWWGDITQDWEPVSLGASD